MDDAVLGIEIGWPPPDQALVSGPGSGIFVCSKRNGRGCLVWCRVGRQEQQCVTPFVSVGNFSYRIGDDEDKFHWRREG